jgi:hypothetical protein
VATVTGTDVVRGVVLYASSLLSKWGFRDGDEPDDYLDWLDDQQLPHPEDWHQILRHLVRTRLLPLIDEDIKVYDIETNHNPIRASTVNGVDIDDARASNHGVLHDVDVTIPYAEVYAVQEQLRGHCASA